MSEPAHGPAYAELRAEIEELRSDIKVIIKSRDKWLVACKDRDATIARLEAEKAQKQLVIDDCKRNLQEQDAAIARLTQELEEARRWVNDLQSGMYINCVYCGHRYGPKDKVPCTMADALKQHIEQCPKHPMSSLRAELADLKDGLTAAHMDGFASGKAEAKEMLRKRDGQLEELRAKLEQAEAELAAERGKVEERLYPCADCGKLRTKDEGGTTFTVCDECWDKRMK